MPECSYCGRDVSWEASVCPGCGQPDPSEPKSYSSGEPSLVAGFFGWLIFGGFSAAVFGLGAFVVAWLATLITTLAIGWGDEAAVGAAVRVGVVAGAGVGLWMWISLGKTLLKR